MNDQANSIGLGAQGTANFQTLSAQIQEDCAQSREAIAEAQQAVMQTRTVRQSQGGVAQGLTPQLRRQSSAPEQGQSADSETNIDSRSITAEKTPAVNLINLKSVRQEGQEGMIQGDHPAVANAKTNLIGSLKSLRGVDEQFNPSFFGGIPAPDNSVQQLNKGKKDVAVQVPLNQDAAVQVSLNQDAAVQVSLDAQSQKDNGGAKPIAVDNSTQNQRVNQNAQTTKSNEDVKAGDKGNKQQVTPGQGNKQQVTPGQADKKKALDVQKQVSPSPVVEYHKPSLMERIRSGMIKVVTVVTFPIVFAGKVVAKAVVIVTKPLVNFVILPVYNKVYSLLYPAKSSLKQMNKEMKAGIERRQKQQAQEQRLEQACIDLAKRHLTDLAIQIQCEILARRYRTTPEDVQKRVQRHMPRVRLNESFKTALTAGGLHLYKTPDQSGDKQSSRPYVWLPQDGKGESAEYGKLHGNDPELVEQLQSFNEANADFAKKQQQYNRELEKFNKAYQKAQKEGVSCPGQKPIAPVAPEAPRFQCTDDNLKQAYLLDKALEKLEKNAADLDGAIDKLKSKNSEDYSNFIHNLPNLDSEEALVKIRKMYNMLQSERSNYEMRLNELQQKQPAAEPEEIQKCEEYLDEIDIKMHICELKRDLRDSVTKVDCLTGHRIHSTAKYREDDVAEWKGAFFEKTADGGEYGGKHPRDRLRLSTWSPVVYKDKDGNVVDIRDKYPNTKAKVDNEKLSQVVHMERAWPKLSKPEFDGRHMPNPTPYADQTGLRWSPDASPYYCYQVEHVDGGEDKSDNQQAVVPRVMRSDQVNSEETYVPRHWVAKASVTNGNGDGYYKDRPAGYVVVEPPVQPEEGKEFEPILPSYETVIQLGNLGDSQQPPPLYSEKDELSMGWETFKKQKQ